MRLPIDVGRKELIWFGVTGVLFVLLLYFADLDQFLTSLARANPTYFAVAFVVGFSSLLVWAWVWHRFFGQLGIASTPSRTVRMFLTGHFLNSITPLGQFGGEPIMAYIVSDTTGTDYERALACVVSADILNAAPFFTFTLGGVVYLAVFGTLNGLVLQIGAISAVLLVVGGLLVYVLWSEETTFGETIDGALATVQRRLGRGEGVFQSLREGVHNVEEAFEEAGSDPAFLLKTTVVSHLAILAQIVSLYFVFLSIGVAPAFVPIYFVVNLSVIATLSPTPGGSGTYEAAFAGLVTFFFTVDFTTALSAAVLFRLTTYWPGLVVGYPSLLSLNRRSATDGVEQEL